MLEIVGIVGFAGIFATKQYNLFSLIYPFTSFRSNFGMKKINNINKRSFYLNTIYFEHHVLSQKI